MNYVFAVLVIVICVCSIYWASGSLTRITMHCTNKRVCVRGKLTFRKPSARQRLVSMLPIYQMVALHKTLYNGHAGYTFPLAILVPGLIALRLAVFFFTNSEVLLLITAVGVMLAIVIHHVLYAVMIFDVARMVQASMPVRVLCIILPYFAAFFLYEKVPVTFKSYYKDQMLKEAESAD